MHEIRGGFEDDGVGQLDAPCIAFRLQSRRTGDG